jgi:hypothetical protein
MKSVMFTLILALSFTASMASKNTDLTVQAFDQPTVEKQVQFEEALNVAELIGVSENSMSEELMGQMNLLSFKPHFYFHTLQQCQAIPECVCQQEGALWACYIY